MRECLYSASRVGWLPSVRCLGEYRRLALKQKQEHFEYNLGVCASRIHSRDTARESEQEVKRSTLNPWRTDREYSVGSRSISLFAIGSGMFFTAISDCEAHPLSQLLSLFNLSM